MGRPEQLCINYDKRRQKKNKKNLRLHRLITGAEKGEVVDHIDGNPLNNLRSNLRVTSQANNTINSRPRKGTSSQYKGVCWYKAYSKWQCRINHEGKTYHLGYFDSEHDAARMYNFWAVDLFGEFARLNVIKEGESA